VRLGLRPQGIERSRGGGGGRLSPSIIESYRKFKVSTLYMPPVGGSLREFIAGMRSFAKMMRAAG
jgi:hypothetical protein